MAVSFDLIKEKISYDSNNNPIKYSATIQISGLATGDDASPRKITFHTYVPGSEQEERIFFDTSSSVQSVSFAETTKFTSVGYSFYWWSETGWNYHSGGSLTPNWPPLRWTKWDGLKVGDIIQSNSGITADDWNNFTTRINEMREYQEKSQYIFTKVEPGDLITAAIYNEAVAGIDRPKEDRYASPVVAGQTLISAECFKNLAKDLNSYL